MEGHTLSPVLDMLDVFGRVLQVIVHGLAVGAQPVGLRRLALLERHGPGAVLDTGCQITG